MYFTKHVFEYAIMVLLDSFKNEHDVTFDIGTAAAHRDAIGAVKSAGVQELERVDKEGNTFLTR